MGSAAVILSEEILHFTGTDVSFSFQNREQRNDNTPAASHKSEGALW